MGDRGDDQLVKCLFPKDKSLRLVGSMQVKKLGMVT